MGYVAGLQIAWFIQPNMPGLGGPFVIGVSFTVLPSFVMSLTYYTSPCWGELNFRSFDSYFEEQIPY